MLRKLALGMALAALLPSAAQAAVPTTSAVTAPADLTRFVDDLNVPDDQPTVTGTSNGSAPDKVDLRCYQFRDGALSGPTWATNVPLAGDGSFSVQLPNNTNTFGPCRLRAVPAGMTPGDLTPFTGPRVIGEEGQISSLSAGVNTGKPYDGYALFSGAKAINDYYSIGSCGPCDHALIDIGTTTTDPTLGFFLWFAGPYLDDFEGAGSRTYALVDGHKTFFAQSAQSAPLNGFTPFPELTWTATHTPSGEGSITDVESPVRCQDDTVTNISQCTSTAALGVAVTRTMRHLDGGQMVRTTDVWRSTDGQAHALDLDYFVDVRGSGNPTWAFPYSGNDAFSAHVAGEQIPGPSSAAALPVSILVNSKTGSAEGSIEAPRGSLTLGQGFTGGRFEDKASIDPHVAGTVPANGTVTVEFVQTITTTTDEARARAAQAEDLLTPPSITLGVPGASTPAATVVASGVASDARKVASVTVNGVPATVAADGSYTATVPLALGPNTLTAVVTDGAGNTASATAATTRTVAPTPADHTPPAVSGLKATATRVSFTSSEAGTATVAVQRRSAGRKVRGRCVKPSRANRRKPHCTRKTTVLTKAVTVKAGANRVALKRLPAGTYAVRVVVRDAAGNTAKAVSRTLVVKKKTKKG